MMTLLFLVGVTVFGLFLTAAITIALNRKLSGWGKLVRAIGILLFPVVGPVIILIEMLLRDIRDDEARAKSDNMVV